jgi:hypothetical protein
MNKLLIFFLLCISCMNPKETNSSSTQLPKSKKNTLPTPNRVRLDKKDFKISQELQYSLSIYKYEVENAHKYDSTGSDHKYFLQVNNSDSIEIASFEWESVELKGVYDNDFNQTCFVYWNDSITFVCVPVYGAFELYPIVKRNNAYFIKKDGSSINTLITLNLFVIDTKRRLAFVPRTRAHGFENGQIETWAYHDKKNKWTILSARFFYDPITKKEIFPDFSDKEIVKRVLKEFKY